MDRYRTVGAVIAAAGSSSRMGGRDKLAEPLDGIPVILRTLAAYPVEQCCYGHLHGPVIRRRIEGERGNTAFSLISAAYLGFVPKKICD